MASRHPIDTKNINHFALCQLLCHNSYVRAFFKRIFIESVEAAATHNFIASIHFNNKFGIKESKAENAFNKISPIFSALLRSLCFVAIKHFTISLPLTRLCAAANMLKRKYVIRRRRKKKCYENGMKNVKNDTHEME